MHASGKQSFLEDTRLFRIFQGCFTVQLSRFFAVVLISSNFYIISLLLKFVNNFFIYFSIFRLKLCVSCCLCQTASLYYHPFQYLSTPFFRLFSFFIKGTVNKPQNTVPIGYPMATAIWRGCLPGL